MRMEPGESGGGQGVPSIGREEEGNSADAQARTLSESAGGLPADRWDESLGGGGGFGGEKK